MNVSDIIMGQIIFMSKLFYPEALVLFLGKNIMNDLEFDVSNISYCFTYLPVPHVTYYRGILINIDDNNDETISVRNVKWINILDAVNGSWKSIDVKHTLGRIINMDGLESYHVERFGSGGRILQMVVGAYERETNFI